MRRSISASGGVSIPTPFLHCYPTLISPGVYSNALLASLNGRNVIRGHIQDVDSNFQNKSYLTQSRRTRTTILTAPVEIMAATELAAQNDHEAEIYADGYHMKVDRAEVRSILF